MPRHHLRFVTRIKENTPVQLIETRPVIDDSIHSDRLIRLTHRMSSHRKNPLQEDTLREIAVILDNGTCVRVLTNDLISNSLGQGQLESFTNNRCRRRRHTVDLRGVRQRGRVVVDPVLDDRRRFDIVELFVFTSGNGIL